MQYKAPVINQFQWVLDISLRDDFQSIVYQDLLRAGYADANSKDAVYQYYNLMKRKITVKPRTVLFSKEFKCPVGYELALSEFVEKAKKGVDLTPFQSQKIKLSAYNDLLLNDWDIQHFHLSRRYRNDGFVSRSQYQIFARVTDETVYLIQIYRHDAEDLYSKIEMVRILRDNWPETVERFHMGNVAELTEKMDDHQYGMLRDAHAMTFVELGKNQVYFPIGGGYMSSGHSASALRQADNWLNRLSAIQLNIKNNAEWIGKTINRYMGRIEPYCNLQIRLLWIDSIDKLTMCELNSGLIIQAETAEGWIRVCRVSEVFGQRGWAH